MTKLTTRCRKCATVSACTYLMGATLICGLEWNGKRLSAQEKPASTSFQPMNQDAAPPNLANRRSTTNPIEAPVPSTESSQESRDDVEILMRGPLHEAFAHVQQTNPIPGPVFEKKPPEPVDELLPDYKPDGANVAWIPGYWSWDDAMSEYIWLSGLWRDLPPGQRWVPGYWEEVNPGYRWVSGFWIAAQVEELSYLPTPPESLDVGPSSSAPSDNYFYTPGNWAYQREIYQWQPGFWQPYVENWVWIPARYVWTPCGYVYCAGYWDRLFQDRGVCFAPVRFSQPAYYPTQYAYRPTCRIVTDVSIFVHLFVRPSCGNYYFGDWYDDRYSGTGYCAWVNYSTRYRSYDPFYNYYHCARTPHGNTTVIVWAESEHRNCQDHAEIRPPHTFPADDEREREHGRRQARSDGVGPLVEDFDRHVRQIDKENKGGLDAAIVRFHRVDDTDRRMARETTIPMGDLQAARHKVETSRSVKTASSNQRAINGLSNGGTKPPKPEIKLALPKSKRIEERGIPAVSQPEKIRSEPANRNRIAAATRNDSDIFPLTSESPPVVRSGRRADRESADRINETTHSEPLTRSRDSSKSDDLSRSGPAERNRTKNSVPPSVSPPSDKPRQELNHSSSNEQPKINLDLGNPSQGTPNRIDRSKGSGQSRNQFPVPDNQPRSKSGKQAEIVAPGDAPAATRSHIGEAPAVLQQGRRSQFQPRIADQANTVTSPSPLRQAHAQSKIERNNVEPQTGNERFRLDSQPKVERRIPETRQQSYREPKQESNSNRSPSPPDRGSESNRGGERRKKD